jgi:hypothetical protein
MNKAKCIFIFFLLSLQVVVTNSCTHPEESEKELTLRLLQSAHWKINSLHIDGVDKSTTLPGLSLKFSETGFVSENGGMLWPTAGGWHFQGEKAKVIIRSDDLEVTIVEIHESKLALSFQWTRTTIGSGKEKSIAGNHLFIFGI